MNVNDLIESLTETLKEELNGEEENYQVVFNYEFYKDFEYYVHRVVLDKVKKQLILECDLKGRK